VPVALVLNALSRFIVGTTLMMLLALALTSYMIFQLFFTSRPLLGDMRKLRMSSASPWGRPTVMSSLQHSNHVMPRPVTPSESFVLKEKRATSAFSTSSWVSQSVLAPYFLVSRKSSQLAKREQQRARLAIINIFFIAIVVCVG